MVNREIHEVVSVSDLTKDVICNWMTGISKSNLQGIFCLYEPLTYPAEQSFLEILSKI